MLLANKELQEMNKSRVDPALEKYNPGINAETKVTPFCLINPKMKRSI